MSNWIERAEAELEEQYDNGDLTIKEFNQEMRNLHEEARQEAENAADEARDNYYR